MKGMKDMMIKGGSQNNGPDYGNAPGPNMRVIDGQPLNIAHWWNDR